MDSFLVNSFAVAANAFGGVLDSVRRSQQPSPLSFTELKQRHGEVGTEVRVVLQAPRVLDGNNRNSGISSFAKDDPEDVVPVRVI